MESARITSRPWLLAGAAGALLLTLTRWCARAPAIAVDAILAQRAPLLVEVNTNGTVEVIPDAELRLHARLDGRIVEILEPGTHVAKGDTILRIDADLAESELASAESEILAAREAMHAARRQLELVSKRAATDDDLFSKGALTSQRHAESQASVREARARALNLESEVPLRVASLEHRVAQLRAQVEAATVTAPFGGTVYRTEFRKGEMVRVGDPILWVADLGRLRVRANVDQVDLGRVRAGQPMRVTSNAYPDRSWSAVVSELVPHVVVKDNRSVAEGLALVRPPTEGLVPGMTVDVDIVVDDVAETLQVPPTAVYTADGDPYVFRIAGGRAERTPVVLGRSSVQAVEILQGLETDDRVIVSASNGLTDGTRVEAQLRDVAAR
jgi:RND family efflux transporter MFP subunit